MNHTEVSIIDAVNQILASPAPILFPDTCTLLDLVRIPFRRELANTASQAQAMLNAAIYLTTQARKSPPNLWVVIPPLVHDEWNDHIQHTTDQLTQHLSDLDAKIDIVSACADGLGLVLPPIVRYSNRNIENHLVNLSHDFFNNCLFLARDTDCVTRASNRVIQGEAPSNKGGGLKDCVIIEHSIELCSQLRTAGFTAKCVFTTSNTADFCWKKPTEPKEPLKSQLGSINLSLTTNWGWTKAELGV